MRLMAPLLALLLLLSLSFAAVSSIQLTQPAALVTSGGQVDYGGYVGPGQTFTVEIDPIANEKGQFLGQWYQAYATDLPQGWNSRPSKTFQKPLQVEITPAPDTPDGDYVVLLALIQEPGHSELGGSFPFQVLVHVRHDVLSMSVDPASAEVGAGQPARFTLTLTNTGSAPDVFEITSSGVSGWAFNKRVYLAPSASKTITYELAGSDEADYHVQLSARSISSPLIGQQQPVALTVRTNLISDYKATSHGVLLFPILMVPVYSLSGILSLFFA